MTDTSPADWPFTLADPVRAVHFALDPGCPHDRPQTCPDETQVRQMIDAYRTWLTAHPTADDRTVIDEQPAQHDPVASHGPHSPSGAPEGAATRDRGTRSRTAGRAALFTTVTAPTAALAVRWAGTLRDLIHAEHGDQMRLHTAIELDTPDSGTDSQDNAPDTDMDTPADSPLTSTDTVRTTVDNGLRCICGDPIEPWTGPGDPGWIHSPGSDTTCLDARPVPDGVLREQYAAALAKCRTLIPEGQADAVLAVRDRRMEQLAAGRATWKTKAEEIERDRDRPEEAVRRVLEQRQELAAERYEWQERALRAEATVARVRAVAEGDMELRDYVEREALREALDAPPAEQPAPPATLADAQQRHIQILRDRLTARQALEADWDAREQTAIRDVTRLTRAEQPTPAADHGSCCDRPHEMDA